MTEFNIGDKVKATPEFTEWFKDNSQAYGALQDGGTVIKNTGPYIEVVLDNPHNGHIVGNSWLFLPNELIKL